MKRVRGRADQHISALRPLASLRSVPCRVVSGTVGLRKRVAVAAERGRVGAGAGVPRVGCGVRPKIANADRTEYSKMLACLYSIF